MFTRGEDNHIQDGDIVSRPAVALPRRTNRVAWSQLGRSRVTRRYAGEYNQGPCRRVWRTVGQHGDELEALKGNMQLHHFEDLSGCTLKLFGVERLGLETYSGQSLYFACGRGTTATICNGASVES